MKAAFFAVIAGMVLGGLGSLIEVARPGEASDDNYGEAVAGGGDVNGDGRGDHLVTAIFNDQVASAAGKASLYLGGAPARSQPDLTFTGEAANDQFGVSAALGGDFNGDGYADILVGARFSDRSRSDAGAVFVFFGGPSPGSAGGMDDVPDLVLTGEAQNDWFGNSVDFAGDVNGDGFDDILVGAPYNDDRGSAAGKGYLYLGGAVPNASPDVFLLGSSQEDKHLGWSVSHAGDVNGDGYSDVILGARLYGAGSQRAAGRAYLFFGGKAPDGTADLIMTGERSNDWFGSSVSAAGDFNQDGFDDVAVGAVFWDDLTDPSHPRISAGRVYLFFGGSAGVMDSAADWAASGERSDDQFGGALAAGGDVDGNGASDLLVGSRFYDDLSGASAKSAAGKVYVYFGASGAGSPAGAPGFTRTGLRADDQLGNAVSGAGDGNGDGLSEILAGAHFADPTGSGSGAASLSFLDCLDLDVGPAQIAWNGCGSYLSFEVLRGDASSLGTTGFGACVAWGLREAPLVDTAIPSPGGIFTYLISGKGRPSQQVLPLGFGAGARARPPRPACP